MPLTMNLIRQLIDEHVAPEDVFSYQALRRWAIANGFTNPNESAEWRKTVVEAHLAKCKRSGSDTTKRIFAELMAEYERITGRSLPEGEKP